MPFYYFESDMGCGIRKYRNIEQAKKEIKIEVGTYNYKDIVREATEEDISWVKTMGGYIPKN